MASVRSLPKQLQEKAMLELNEVPTRIQDDIDHIREWLSKQRHLKARTDDQWILNFLRGSKFSLQRTKEKLECYYIMRSLSPEYFANRNPFVHEMQAYFEQRLMTPLPNDPSLISPWRLLVRAKNANPEIATITVCFKALFMLVDILTYQNDYFVVNGQEVIFDLEDLDYNYITQLTPMVLKKIVDFSLHSYASRIKNIYFVNVPKFFCAVINIFLPLLPDKLKSRVHIYSKNQIKNIHEFIPCSVLPEEYGGQAGPFGELAKDNLQRVLESHYTWLLDDSKYGCDETERPNMSKWLSECSDKMNGSFRKLELD